MHSEVYSIAAFAALLFCIESFNSMFGCGGIAMYVLYIYALLVSSPIRAERSFSPSALPGFNKTKAPE